MLYTTSQQINIARLLRPNPSKRRCENATPRPKRHLFHHSISPYALCGNFSIISPIEVSTICLRTILNLLEVVVPILNIDCKITTFSRITKIPNIHLHHFFRKTHQNLINDYCRFSPKRVVMQFILHSIRTSLGTRFHFGSI